MAKKIEWYKLDKILAHNATYNIIIGKRSNGKTYAVQELMLKRYLKDGSQGAIIRRWEEDYRGKRGQQTFDHLICNAEKKNVVKELTKGEWDRIRYFSGKWYLARYDEELDKLISAPDPFCYAFALTTVEHDKSTSYPNIETIVFDEFITREYYLPDEFVSFMNTLSTIIRHRNTPQIFMLGNTVNKYCPYFAEMGLKGIEKQGQGTIAEYTYVNNNELKVAVEYCGEGKSTNTKLASDKYFGFENPKLSMITSGVWEIGSYPHLPYKIADKDVKFNYFIIFGEDTLHCKIVHHGKDWFTFIHRKTTPIKDPEKAYVYQTTFDPRYNWKRKITKPQDDFDRFILWFYTNEKIFYATNEVGEVVRNYLQWCMTDKMV